MKLVIFQDAQVVARTWRQAFAEFGFCQAIGHGVPDRGRAETDEMMCGIHSVHQKMTWKKKKVVKCVLEIEIGVIISCFGTVEVFGLADDDMLLVTKLCHYLELRRMMS